MTVNKYYEVEAQHRDGEQYQELCAKKSSQVGTHIGAKSSVEKSQLWSERKSYLFVLLLPLMLIHHLHQSGTKCKVCLQCKYAIFICKYANMQICKYANMQMCKYAIFICSQHGIKKVAYANIWSCSTLSWSEFFISSSFLIIK